MFGEAPLADDAIASVLSDRWRLAVAAVEYRPIGYGSYHWLANSPDQERWFVTVDSASGPFDVAAAYSVARRLSAAGLGFVRAPVPSCTGRVVEPVAPWLVSVWPWVEGRASTGGVHESPADLVATLRCVLRLHESEMKPVPTLIETWDLDGRAELTRLLAGEGWEEGPYAVEARELLERGRSSIERDLARYDDLAESMEHGDLVVTHGEPHAANVVHTATGPMLIDWDTVRWAPRERDLWSLIDQAGFREGYGDAPLNATALEVYRLQWLLTEIADFAVSLATAPTRNADRDIAIRELRNYLAD